MMRMALLLVGMVCLPGLACALSFGEYATVELAPARGQVFEIPIRLEQPAMVEVSIFTSDGDLVRTLRSGELLDAGAHSLSWDGKDDEGTIVPDEAYVPVLKARTAAGEEQIIDPRKTSGGEVVDDLRVEITPGKDIAYYLPAPSRVLIRAGIKGGPMLRSLASWEPRAPGKNVQRWDGRDQDGLVDIRGEENLTVLVAAFRLPEHSIIATGNSATDYRTYRKSKNWPDRLVPPEQMTLVRGDTRIARDYYFPRTRDAVPKVTLTLPEDLPRSADGRPLVKLGQAIPVKADIAKADRWLMEESLYEVAFFVDHVFMAEEEQGYVPLTWIWSPRDLVPGGHIFTVNISGFSGKVGVASLLFKIAE